MTVWRGVVVVVALATAGCGNGELSALQKEVRMLNDEVESLRDALREANQEIETASSDIETAQTQFGDCDQLQSAVRLMSLPSTVAEP